MVGKLTPTTNDQLQNGGLKPHIVAAMPAPSPAPLELPTFPLPEKPKRGRKTGRVATPPQVAVPTEARPLKIALIGTAPSSRMLAPFNDPSWTIWACSPGNMGTALPRFDAWVEVHGTNLLEPENANYGPQYIEWMKSLRCPVYMQDQRLVPNAITIPKDDLVREYGPYFFTSSFSWMIAMAIEAGAKEIALFGIDMASRDEYIIQRPGAYHFFQEAARRGVKMFAPYESDIFQPPGLYGYSDVTPFGRKLRARKSELQQRLGPMRQQRDQLNHDITYLEGALEDNDYCLSIQGGVQDNSDISFLERLRQAAEKEKKMTQQPFIATLASGT